MQLGQAAWQKNTKETSTAQRTPIDSTDMDMDRDDVAVDI